MPPINPSLIPQQGQARTLAGAPPAMPSVIPNGAPILPTNDISNQHTQVETNRTQQMTPLDIQAKRDEIETQRLNLRALRIKNGLDPDTGKPSTTAGVAGDMGLQDLPQVKQDEVKAIVHGRFPVTPYMLARNPELGQLVDRAFQYEPGTDLTTFQKRNSAFQKFQSDPKSPVVRLNQSLEHLGVFNDAAEALKNAPSGMLSFPENVAHATGMTWNQDPRVTAFNTAKHALMTELAATFKGSNNPSEAAILRDLETMPLSASSSQYKQFANTAANLLGGRIDANQYQFEQALGPGSNGYDLMSPKAKAAYERFSSPEFMGQDTQSQLSDKEKPAFTIPQGYQDEHAQFLAHHPKGSLTIPDYLAFRQEMDKKYGNPGAPLASDLDPEKLKAFVNDYNKLGESPDVKIPSSNIPLTPFEKASAEQVEGPGGAFLANAGNAAALGLPEALMGNDKRDLFHDISEKSGNKVASTAGDVLGSIAPIGGLEKGGADLIAKLAPNLNATARMKLLGSVGANAAYGGVRGFNGADSGEGGTGALEGAGGGALGALGGNLATRGLTPLVSDATAQALKSMKGISTTTLQRLGLGEGEQMLKSVPFAHGAMKDAMKSYNLAEANKALAPLGEVVPKGIKAGPDLNAHVNQVASNHYDLIKPHITGSIDDKFDGVMKVLETQADTPAKKEMFAEIKSAVSSLGKAAPAVPAKTISPKQQDVTRNLYKYLTGEELPLGYNPSMEEMLGASRSSLRKAGNFELGDVGPSRDPTPFLSKPIFDGESYQTATSKLRDLTEALANDTHNPVAAQQMSRVADAARKQVKALVSRQVPEDVATNLNNVEKTWAIKSLNEDATRRALAGQGGIYSPSQKLTSIKVLDTSKGKGASARGIAPGQPETMDAQHIMGSGTVPTTSSLKESSIAALGLGLGHWAAPGVAPVVGGAATALYGPGVRNLTRAIVAPNGARYLVNEAATRNAIADAIRHRMTGN